MATHHALPLSGGGLNLKVVGSTTQPTSPKENTIWVNTSVSIGNYQFCSTEPSVRPDGSALSNGDIWIEVSSISDVSCNISKKSKLLLSPIECRQYISGAWVVKPAKSYIDGQWTDWVYYLYGNGSLTTGCIFSRPYVDYSLFDTYNNQITISIPVAGQAKNPIYIGHKVDLTNKSTVEMSVLNRTSTNYGWCGIIVTDTATIENDALDGYNDVSSKYVVRTLDKDSKHCFTQTLDVSSLTGEYYVWFGFMIFHSNATGSVIIDEVKVY